MYNVIETHLVVEIAEPKRDAFSVLMGSSTASVKKKLPDRIDAKNSKDEVFNNIIDVR